MIFNAALCVVTSILAASCWNDPAQQFAAGMNFVVAVWCGLDFLKAAWVKS